MKRPSLWSYGRFQERNSSNHHAESNHSRTQEQPKLLLGTGRGPKYKAIQSQTSLAIPSPTISPTLTVDTSYCGS